jgi:Tfp pilus assembly protein PilZ
MRRQNKRIPLRSEEIRIITMTETTAQVTDLSSFGIGLKSSKRLRPGSPCTVTIGGNGSLLVIQGKSVWEKFAGWTARPGGKVDAVFFLGIRLDEERPDLLVRACEGACDSGKTVRVRVPDMTVRLSYAESLNVLNLSSGGVLAEALNPFEPGTERIVRLFLPDSSDPIKCVTRVTSCKTVRHESDKQYHIGLEFIGMDDFQAERLKIFTLMLSAI